MAEQHPYTHIYTDAAGRSLSVEIDAGQPLIIAAEGEESTFIYAPTGEEAVAVARAILALGGDTGHVVVSRDELTAMQRAAARSMQERAVRALHLAPVGTSITGTLRALPLLPSSDATEDALGPTHAEQPDSLSPCGLSTWDVPATSDLSEVECLDCLRTLAQASRGDAAEVERLRRIIAQSEEDIAALRAREQELAAQRKEADMRIEAVHQLHSRTSHDPTRCYCSNAYPCRTIQAINSVPRTDAEAPAAPTVEAPTLDRRVAALEELTGLLADIVERHSLALEPGQKQPPADS